KYHDFRYYTNDYRPDWWAEQRFMLDKLYRVGDMAYSAKFVKSQASRQKTMAILNGKVYDLTDYMRYGRAIQGTAGDAQDLSGVERDFLDQQVVDLFTRQSGNDITKLWDTLSLSDSMRQDMETCLSNLFYIGVVDTRNSPKCLFSVYLLLAISIMLVSVIG